ncbi:MAG TPA: Gfo/Idh/MocA family oxidoreductase [Verrucomicrobiae bacterium]|jgi:predicted dehydrogenase|nr:Gfo/Idh/MocA family oxidoreductase [Verrucomicrobiae bacterium]
MKKEMTRRNFLGASAMGALAVGAFPFVRSARAGEPGANDKIRLGLIGCGGMGQGDLKCFFLNPEVDCAVICDVDDAQLGKVSAICEEQRHKKPDTEKDFRRVLERKDVDFVLIATPDHWHALPMVMAAQAGKDVYVEKPLAKTIAEGRAMLEASQRHNRIVQMGSQWRSAPHIIEATEIIRSGKLGKVSLARAWAFLDWLPSIGHVADSAPPAGVDYDMWLGPSPLHPFNANRFHFNFRWFWDYAGGLMTDWGVHLLNIASMGLPAENPKSVTSCGGKFIFDDDSQTPDSQVTVFEFPSCQLIWEHRAGLNNGLNGRSWGVEWHGTEGNIILNDEGWALTTERKRANLDSQTKPGSGDPRARHVRNFLDCCRSRQQPVLNLELGHRLSALAHLGNIAYRTGAKIQWDSAAEKIVDNPAADKLVGATYREPWHLPYLAPRV